MNLNHLSKLDDFNGTLSQRTYQVLRKAILDLTFNPGELIRKSEICKVLQVSRSPVSEAIAKLVMDGLVVVVPQAGTFVSRFDMQEIRKSAFLREAIELAAVERVAQIITDEQIALLRRNLKMQRIFFEDDERTEFYKLDAEMHSLILSFTGFDALDEIADRAWIHVNRARQQLLPIEGRIETTLMEHEAIIEAIANHDVDAARNAMRHHLSQLMTFLEPLEVEKPELFNPGKSNL